MSWIKDTILSPYPELLIFATIALGFVIGKIRYKAIGVGAVTGCLVAGLILGQFDVPIAGPVKSCFFILFLFALGYRVGPQFFRGLRKGGLPQVLTALVVCLTGLVVCVLFAKMLGYGPGLSAGLLGGALTQSSVIGVAGDAISNLPGLDHAQAASESNLVAVAYAVTYPLGTILAAVLLANIIPRLLHKDLAVESAKLAEEMDVDSGNPDLGAGYYEVVLRAHRIADGPLVGRTIESFEQEQKKLGRRIYLTRVRRDGKLLDHDQRTVLLKGDTVAVSAIRGHLLDFEPVEHIGPESDDVELLGYQTESLHVVCSSRRHLGKTIGALRAEPFMTGVFVDKMYRNGFELPYRLGTELERGDTLILTGPQRLVDPAAAEIGKPVPTSFNSDMAWVGLGVVLGGLIGIPALTVSGVPISLSTSGGALIMGLIFGWIRGKYPTYGNVPPGAQWFMDTFGLCAFVGIVGLNAAPQFVSGLSQAGWGLLAFGAVASVVPLLAGFLVGHFVFKLKLPILVAVLAGAQTTTAAIGAINEAAKSNLPTLGYTIPYAVGNVLLTIWGAVAILLCH